MVKIMTPNFVSSPHQNLDATRMPKRCCILFVRAPVLGCVKTRLAAALNDQAVLNLYHAFVSDILQTLELIAQHIIISFTPADQKDAVTAWLGAKYEYLPQQGSDLGQRMRHALESAFAAGYSQALLIGSDIPDLPGRILQQAYEDLESADAVIGPTVDGGYYLIGFKQDTFLPQSFDNIAWSTGSVLTDTVSIFKLHQRQLSVLSRWQDIDRFEDLVMFFHRNQNTNSAPQTMALLRNVQFDQYAHTL